MELTLIQKNALAQIRDFESGTDLQQGILYGPPACGKTQVITNLIEGNRPRPGQVGKRIDVVVTHYSCIYEICKTLRRSKVSNEVFVINGQGDFRYLQTKLRSVGRIVVLCMDTHFRRVCDLLRDVQVSRIVFENVECLNICAFEPPDTSNIWFVTSHEKVLAKRARTLKSKFWRTIAFAKEAHEGVQMDYEETVPNIVAHGSNNVTMFSEPDKRVMNSAAKKLFDDGRDSLAISCIAGQNVRREDASIILNKKSFDKLQEICPICYEERNDLPRIVTPCCENNFCAKCFVACLEVSNACPMCRTICDETACYKIHSTPIVVIRDIVEETGRIIRSLQQTESPKILVVATQRFFGSIVELMWRVDLDFVELSGNRYTMRKRTEKFASEPNSLAVVEHGTMGFAPIRLTRLTHVVFIGGVSPCTMRHWTSRAITPKTLSSLPESVLVQSVYDLAFQL